MTCSVCRGEEVPDFGDRCHKLTYVADSIVLDDQPIPVNLGMSASGVLKRLFRERVVPRIF